MTIASFRTECEYDDKNVPTLLHELGLTIQSRSIVEDRPGYNLCVFSFDKAALALESEVETAKQNGLNEISEKYIIELNIDATKDGDKVTALINSIKKQLVLLKKVE